VQVNFCGLHTNTNVWGETAMLWNPARFIDKTPGSESALESEQLRSIPEGVYVPWSHGERVCPGKRFSQVELAAVLAVLFRKHRVEVVPEGHESPAEARKRAQMVSLDIQMTLLNEIYQPERIGLKWLDVE
jgi:cytochrome P450